jgi:transposase
MGNLCEVIERLLQRHAGHMREAARQVNETLQLDDALAEEATSSTGSVALRAPKPRGWERLSEQRRAARLARYEEAVRQHAGGASIKSIARAMKLNYRTVRNFVRSGSYPERARRSRGPALSEAQRQHVASRVAEGCHNAVQLWRELQAQGFAGHCSVVHDAMARASAATPSGRRRGVVAASAPAMGVPSTRRACAWLLGCKDPESEEQDSRPRRRFVETLCGLEPSIAEARGLAQRFLGFIHRKDLAGFDRWLPRVRTCNVPELRRFSVKLREDLSAVRAAFSSPWSSGQVEGQINRLKYLKRQMYGRAKLDLLRIRVLHPN